MNTTLEFIWSVLLTIIIIGTISIGLSLGITIINNTFIENIPSIVKVNGKIVYEGISAGYEIGSSGAHTTVSIMKKPLYIFPEAYYVSKEVEVINKIRIIGEQNK